MGEGSRAFINGKAILMDEKDTRAEGVLVKEGKIIGTGTSKEIEEAAKKEGILVTDLKGKAVLPGFHDCHVHVIGTGMASMCQDRKSVV